MEALTEFGSRPWHAAYDPGVPTTLEYPETTLDGLLRTSASKNPDDPAIHFFGRTIDYRTLDTLVDRASHGLHGLGVTHGDRVAVFMPNCPQAVITYHAIWRAGGIAVPVNPLYTAVELQRQIADSGASILIALSGFQDRLGLEMPTLRHIVLTGIKEYFPPVLRFLFTLTQEKKGGHRIKRPLDDRTLTFDDLLKRGSDEPVDSPADQTDPAALFYTGGTTGLPKAAVLTHRNMVVNASQVAVWAVGLDPGAEVMMTALPLSHSYAMTVCMNVSVMQGWAQVLVPDPRDLKRLLENVEKHRVTVLPGVPTLYAAINERPEVKSGQIDLSSVEVCISGAAGLPPEVQAEFERVTGGRLVEGYGLTEASPVTHANPIGSGDRVGTIGLPVPDTDCKIVDVESETITLEPGQAGILCISGPQVMKEYWNRPEETDATLRRDREGKVWLHTGDVAEMSTDGYFRIIDRQKDMILASGGLNVYPREIEDELYTHPAVYQAAVIGVPVGGINQRAKGFVVLRPGHAATEEELITYLQGRLARFKVPKSIEFRDELPLAFTGKVLRRILAEEEKDKQSGESA